MKKILCIALAIVMLILSGCELPFVFDNTVENENIQELVYQLSKTIDMSKYNPLDIAGNSAFYRYTDSHMDLPEFDKKVILGETTVIELSKTTIGDLIDKGFKVTESEDDECIWLSLDDDELCIYRDDFDKPVENLEIDSVCLKATDEYIDYEYHGATKDATLESIVEMWGQPGYELQILATEGLDDALVVFSYFSLSCSVDVYFTYDAENESFIYDELVITK